jgi:hypothetical protein
MVANILSVEAPAAVAGFQIRLRDPASLAHQQGVIPATHSIVGCEVSGVTHGETGYSFETFQYSQLIADTVRFAHKHEVGEGSIQKMIADPKSELFGSFEQLGFEVCKFLAQRGAQARAESKDCMRGILQHAGNDALVDEFDAVYESLSCYLNFNIGLVRDCHAASFGESSATYRFRVFGSPDPLVLLFGFDEGDIQVAAQASAVFHQLVPVGMMESFAWHDEVMCRFWDEGLKFNAPNGTPLSLFDAVIEQVTEIQDELDGRFTDEDCALDELELLNTEFAEKILSIAGSPSKAAALFEDAKGLMEFNGWMFSEALGRLLSLAKYRQLKREFSQLRVECEANDDLVLHADSTYFSSWLGAAKVYIQDTVDLASKRSTVFSCVGESDIALDATVIVDPITIPNLSFLQDDYQDNYERLMDGEVDTASSCIFLNDDTIAAIEGWQRAVAIIAAMSAASNVRKE